ncbi:MAG: iron-containing alcohol dehydrogenase [Eubacteriales bacterium]|nr:iron-containing alcohol dehydrogenase [Eubacteriales bacterium]MDD4389753.1 iron-containing alcohol dehydrogenase [Eubacteriales bacterium]
MNFNFYMPVNILFGSGQLNNLAKQELPGSKAMIVISEGKSAKSNGYLDRLQKQLSLAGKQYIVFDQIEANPLKDTVTRGAEFCKANGCDFIVALGGGSCIDAAKAIALMAVNPGDLWDYVAAGSGKGMDTQYKPLPLVAIPTTSGTGSEADASSVITNEVANEKTGYVNKGMFPYLSIVDPELTLSIPPLFTALQGFDALFHNIEGYLSNAANPISDMYALKGVSCISSNITEAVNNGSNLKAREALALGSTLGGVVMVAGKLTSHHSLEHALSAYHQHLPHGAGLVLLSKAYFAHMINNHVCDDRFIDLARAMGIQNASSPTDFLTALSNLLEACGVSKLKMSDYGITPDEFEKFTDNAKRTMAKFFSCDRLPLSDEDCINIYKNSY